MRILSLNAWGGRLHEPLIRYLAAADPDVVCLQEVTRTPGTPSDWLLYRDGDLELPQRADLFTDVSRTLPEHDGFFSPAAHGELDDEGRTVWSEFGLATFVRKTFPVIAQAMDFVHGAFSAEGWNVHPRARNAHCVRLWDYAGGYPVTIAQMHGLRETAGKGDTPARHAQARSFAALVGRVWRPGERLVACGDFNVLPGSVTFETLDALGLSDLVVRRGFTDTRTSFYKKAERHADYMLVTPAVDVTAFDVVAEPEVSDHRALLLDIA